MAVSNTLHTDQRVDRHCRTLTGAGYAIVAVAACRPGEHPQPPEGHPYRVAEVRTRHRRGWRFYAELNRQLARELPRLKPDAIWANDTDTLAGCWLAARRCRVPLAMDAHELFPEVPEIRHKPLVKWVWRTLERLLMPHCDALLTVCDSIADHYRQELGVQMDVVRNMSDSMNSRSEVGGRKSEVMHPTSALQPPTSDLQPPTSDLRLLLYQGCVNVGRGVDWAIDALEWLDGCRLVVAGGGDLLAQMQAYAAGKPWADRISFTGPLAPEALRRLTPTADVGLVMLEDMGLSYHYAFPNRIGDLVQAGVPMVVSDLPEMARFVRRHQVGEVMHGTGARALADSVQRVLARGRAGYRFDSARADLDWNKEKQQLINIANKLCCTTFC